MKTEQCPLCKSDVFPLEEHLMELHATSSTRIKVLKLEAFKAGMDAARSVCLSNEMINKDRFDCAESILTAAQNLKVDAKMSTGEQESSAFFSQIQYIHSQLKQFDCGAAPIEVMARRANEHIEKIEQENQELRKLVPCDGTGACGDGKCIACKLLNEQAAHDQLKDQLTQLKAAGEELARALRKDTVASFAIANSSSNAEKICKEADIMHTKALTNWQKLKD